MDVHAHSKRGIKSQKGGPKIWVFFVIAIILVVGITQLKKSKIADMPELSTQNYDKAQTTPTASQEQITAGQEALSNKDLASYVATVMYECQGGLSDKIQVREKNVVQAENAINDKTDFLDEEFDSWKHFPKYIEKIDEILPMLDTAIATSRDMRQRDVGYVQQCKQKYANYFQNQYFKNAMEATLAAQKTYDVERENYLIARYNYLVLLRKFFDVTYYEKMEFGSQEWENLAAQVDTSSQGINTVSQKYGEAEKAYQKVVEKFLQ